LRISRATSKRHSIASKYSKGKIPYRRRQFTCLARPSLSRSKKSHQWSRIIRKIAKESKRSQQISKNSMKKIVKRKKEVRLRIKILGY